jgi:hypothetical protein
VLSSIAVQEAAHFSHISAHRPQTSRSNAEKRSKKETLHWHASVQSINTFMCAGSACFPPMAKQCICVSLVVLMHSIHEMMHDSFAMLLGNPEIDIEKVHPL